MYAEYLAFGAWSVDQASDGREALAKAIASRPDVIVTESRLPGISGFDLCSILKQDPATRSIPIVISKPSYALSPLQGCTWLSSSSQQAISPIYGGMSKS